MNNNFLILEIVIANLDDVMVYFWYFLIVFIAGSIALSPPDSDIIKTIGGYLESLFFLNFNKNGFSFLELKLKVTYFDSSEDIDTYVQSEFYDSDTHPKICFGIAFTKWNPPHYEYEIRYNSSGRPN